MRVEHRGASASTAAPPVATLWPDNLPAWAAFMSVQTQWRYVAGGMGPVMATGLDYASVSAYLQSQGYRAQARRGRPALGTILDDLRECEAVTLEEWAREASRNRS